MPIAYHRRDRALHTALFMAFVLGTSLFAFPAAARQQQPQPAGTAAQGNSSPIEKQQDERETGTPDQIAPKNDRLFGVITNYTTVETQDRFSPLSTKGKFKLAADSAFDPYTFPFIGFVALIGQAENSEP